MPSSAVLIAAAIDLTLPSRDERVIVVLVDMAKGEVEVGTRIPPAYAAHILRAAVESLETNPDGTEVISVTVPISKGELS